jgi:UDP-2-acetamido-2,6-beta-L-arabino-hexul-4-ose reductase
MPNIYGPFSKPNHNSFIATFCYKLSRGENPEIIINNTVSLKYISSLCDFIINDIKNHFKSNSIIIKEEKIQPDFTLDVKKILTILELFKTQYFDNGIIPNLSNTIEVSLFNTFTSFIDIQNYFPFLLKQNCDLRGSFVEVLKFDTSKGQFSFSTTKPGITRGNHFHTRKFERFIVIKGKAKVQLRRIGTDKIFSFVLDGNNPSYIDIPVWYTHNITNLGKTDLYTLFWINEWFNHNDSDTYFEDV